MNRRAFTLIELMVTIFVIVLLLAAAAAGVSKARRNGRDAQRLRDVSAISTAVDQSVTTNRGRYPASIITPTASTFCASELGTTATNPNNIPLGIFLSRQIPVDPAPAISSSVCSDYRNGYTYENRKGGTNLANAGVGATNYEYVIEVGLETDTPAEEPSFTRTSTPTTNDRSQFVLYGKPCTVNVSCLTTP